MFLKQTGQMPGKPAYVAEKLGGISGATRENMRKLLPARQRQRISAQLDKVGASLYMSTQESTGKCFSIQQAS